KVNGLFDKADRSIGQEDIHSPWVPAARGGGGLVPGGIGTRQVEFRLTCATPQAAKEEVWIRAIGSRLRIELAIARYVNPVYAPKIQGRLTFGKPGEILAHDHRVAGPIRDITQLRSVIPPKGGPLIGQPSSRKPRTVVLVPEEGQVIGVAPSP